MGAYRLAFTALPRNSRRGVLWRSKRAERNPGARSFRLAAMAFLEQPRVCVCRSAASAQLTLSSPCWRIVGGSPANQLQERLRTWASFHFAALRPRGRPSAQNRRGVRTLALRRTIALAWRRQMACSGKQVLAKPGRTRPQESKSRASTVHLGGKSLRPAGSSTMVARIARLVIIPRATIRRPAGDPFRPASPSAQHPGIGHPSAWFGRECRSAPCRPTLADWSRAFQFRKQLCHALLHRSRL